MWSYVSGFLAELHSSIWRLWPCILAILRDKITSLIGNLLHNFKFLFLFYPWSAPGAPLRPGLHQSHSCIAACPEHLAKIHSELWILGGYISKHRSHFGSRYKLGCCVFAGLLCNRAWFKSPPWFVYLRLAGKTPQHHFYRSVDKRNNTAVNVRFSCLLSHRLFETAFLVLGVSNPLSPFGAGC